MGYGGRRAWIGVDRSGYWGMGRERGVSAEKSASGVWRDRWLVRARQGRGTGGGVSKKTGNTPQKC